MTYWREEPLEVDGVIDGPWGRWAIEVKTGSLSPPDRKGLGEFTRRHPQFRPLVLCDRDGTPVADRAGLPVMPWREFRLHGPTPPAAGVSGRT